MLSCPFKSNLEGKKVKSLCINKYVEDCTKQDCALWYDYKNMCSIKVIALNIRMSVVSEEVKKHD